MSFCCWPPCRSSTPQIEEDNSTKYKPALAAIFEKTWYEQQKEFNDIVFRRFEVPFKAIHPLSQVHSAHDCLDKSMILSAVPEKYSLNDFLTLIYTHADAVMMLMRPDDFIYNPFSVHYFAEDGTLQADIYSVTRKDIECSPFIEKSTLEITVNRDPGTKRSVTHYHYQHWIDGTAPIPESLAALARIVMKAKKPLIHCIAGEGRTGTLAATVSAYQKIKAGDYSHNVIQKSVAELRQERPNAIHNFGQYSAIYDTVKTLLEQDGLLPNN